MYLVSHKKYLSISGCNRTFEISSVTRIHGTSRLHFCFYNFTSIQSNHVIRITFNLPQSGTTAKVYDHGVECKNNYIHVGNNPRTINVKTMTSYKFCGGSKPPQIVSRRQSAWVVYDTNRRFRHIDFTVESLPKGK